MHVCMQQYTHIHPNVINGGQLLICCKKQLLLPYQSNRLSVAVSFSHCALYYGPETRNFGIKSIKSIKLNFGRVYQLCANGKCI